jgi:flagellar biosynthesis protein FlhG
MQQSLSRSDRHDQASRLRELARRGGGSPLTLAILSGKGGVGKTNIAVNLAICLAARHSRVSLVDLDMGLANADLLMGLQPRYTLAQLVGGLRTLDEITIEGPAGVQFIPGASGLHQIANLSEFERQNLLVHLQKLEDNTDIIVFDCGAGISRNVIRFALAAHRTMVVTTPEPTAITDAYATIKTLQREQYRGTVGLLVNKVSSRSEAEATFRRVAGVARRFLNYPIAFLGYVLQDTAVVLAVQARCPVVVRYPGSNASACIAAVADSFVADRSSQLQRDGFFRRVAGLFV